MMTPHNQRLQWRSEKQSSLETERQTNNLKQDQVRADSDSIKPNPGRTPKLRMCQQLQRTEQRCPLSYLGNK